MTPPTFDFESLTTRLRRGMDSVPPLSLRGRVTQVTGTILRAYAPGAKIGELVRL
jgi:type III secretion protein N (ATPase)